MRFWVGGRVLAPDVQTNNPSWGRYWLGGQAFARVYGTNPVPPPGSTALPTGLARARLDDDDWFPPPPREGAPPVVAIVPPYSREPLFDYFAEEPPYAAIQREFVPPAAVLSFRYRSPYDHHAEEEPPHRLIGRAFAPPFVDDDFVVQLIF